jgi:hypothetical protein
VCDDIRNGKAATRFQDAERFPQHAVFVARQVNDAVAYDDIDGGVRQRDMLDFAFEKFDVLNPGLALVLAGECQHFIRHIEAVGFAQRTDPTRG